MGIPFPVDRRTAGATGMSEYVLPRAQAKTKRKKRKPPRPEFWYRLFWVAWDLFFGLMNFLNVVAYESIAVKIFCLTCGGVLLTAFVLSDWPKFVREWELWRKDDEE